MRLEPYGQFSPGVRQQLRRVRQGWVRQVWVYLGYGGRYWVGRVQNGTLVYRGREECYYYYYYY